MANSNELLKYFTHYKHTVMSLGHDEQFKSEHY